MVRKGKYFLCIIVGICIGAAAKYLYVRHFTSPPPEKYVTIYADPHSEVAYGKEILKKGDKISYMNLTNTYLEYTDTCTAGEYILYALMMVNRYHDASSNSYVSAYFKGILTESRMGNQTDMELDSLLNHYVLYYSPKVRQSMDKTL